jgi:HSP20 family protein
MTSSRWNPIRLRPDQLPLLRLDEQIDKAFDALLSTPWLSESSGWTPQVDVYETADAFLIEADLPGVSPDNLQVRIDGDEVTICGTRSESRRDELSHGVVRIERRRGSFCRTLSLGQSVATDGVEVSHEQGVFRIRLPKQPQEDDR